MRFVALGDDFRPREVSDGTCLVFFFRDVVDDVLLGFILGHVLVVFRTHDVDLVVFEFRVSTVDIDDVIRVVDTESGNERKRSR